MVSKNENNKKCAPKLVFFNVKDWEIFQWFLTLKIDFESQIQALFDTSLLHQFSKFKNFHRVYWFLCKSCTPRLKNQQPVLP
jgi:hypothetical protein